MLMTIIMMYLSTPFRIYTFDFIIYIMWALCTLLTQNAFPLFSWTNKVNKILLLL